MVMKSIIFGSVRAIRAGLLIALACVSLFPTRAWGLDAQKIFGRAKDSVVVVVGLDSYGKQNALGSGFFIGDGKVVVTNFHVIKKASRIKIKAAGAGQLLEVTKVLAVNRKYDLALLLLPSAGDPLELAKDHPSVGQEVLAIGNPKGLEKTISTGIVSGIRKKDKDFLVYQITAPISPGSSGGPILNNDGQVLGLASFYMGGGQNLNFAVPSVYIDKLAGSRDVQGYRQPYRKKIEIKKDRSGVILLEEKDLK